MSVDVMRKVFAKLVAAFPEYNPPDPAATLALYAEQFQGEEPEWLNLAADYVIQTAKWFPKVVELWQAVEAVKRIHGGYLPSRVKEDQLLARMMLLGMNTPAAAFDKLAAEFEAIDKPHCAESVRAKQQRIQQALQVPA